MYYENSAPARIQTETDKRLELFALSLRHGGILGAKAPDNLIKNKKYLLDFSLRFMVSKSNHIFCMRLRLFHFP